MSRTPTETFTVVVLSTCHVTAGTAESIDEALVLRGKGQQASLGDQDWRYFLVAERWSDYGWWIWANVEDGREDLPQDLKACLNYAIEHGARWVMFDCDGPEEPDLTRYEW